MCRSHLMTASLIRTARSIWALVQPLRADLDFDDHGDVAYAEDLARVRSSGFEAEGNIRLRRN